MKYSDITGTSQRKNAQNRADQRRAAVTANSQLSRRITFKQAAKLMNVSERSVYSALKLERSGRDDLVTAVERGELSLHAALKQLEPARRPNTIKPLVAAWNAATVAERITFLAAIDADAEAELQICSSTGSTKRENGGAS
jgi:hypothetical protein